MKDTPFGQTTSILDFSPNPRPFKAKDRRNLCWPAWMWQVLAPVPHKRPFNLFQEVVLKMCRAGVSTVEEIHVRIGLGRDLLGFVFLQLQNTGLLDNTGSPTHRACKLLDKDQEEVPEYITGYIFQDPYSGRIWPRFHIGKLKRLQGDFTFHKKTQSTQFSIETGSVGKPRTIRGTLLTPQSSLRVPEPPTALQILRSWRQHHQTSFQFGQLHSRSLGDSQEQMAWNSTQSLEQVSLLSEDPEPVYLTTYLFIPSDSGKSAQWQICDPFGFGISRFLRREVETFVQQHKTLRGLLEQIAGNAFAIEAEDVSELFALLEKHSLGSVENELGQEVQNFPALLRFLCQIEEDLGQLSHFRKVSGESASKKQKAHTAAFLRGLYASIEELLAETQALYPPGPSCPLKGSASKNGALLSLIAHNKLGFHRGSVAGCLDTILQQHHGQLRNVSEFGGRNLPTQVAVMMLSANDDPTHPAYALARTMPNWLLSLVHLKNLRDTAAHGSKKGELPSIEELGRLRKLVYQTTRQLLPGMQQGQDSSYDHTAKKWQIELQLKARHDAARRTAKRLGSELRIPPETLMYLHHMEARGVVLSKLKEASSQQNTRIIGDLVMQAYQALEASLVALLREIAPVITSPKASVELSAAKLGFCTLDDGTLPPSLSKVRNHRIKNVAKYGSGSLGAMACALILDNTPSVQLQALVQNNPNFLLELAQIIKARGHGGRDLCSSITEALKIRELTYTLIRNIHESMP